jgi:hypothetical protein
MPPRYRVSKEALETAAIQEKRAHPWASPRTARRIARDNLSSDPRFYQAESAVNATLKASKPIQKPIHKKRIKQGPHPLDPYNLMRYMPSEDSYP